MLKEANFDLPNKWVHIPNLFRDLSGDLICSNRLTIRLKIVTHTIHEFEKQALGTQIPRFLYVPDFCGSQISVLTEALKPRNLLCAMKLPKCVVI